MKKILLISAAVACLFSCKNDKKDISQFSFMEGKWVGTMNSMQMFEVWRPANGMLMNGQGGAVNGKDTIFSETLKIEQRGEELFYIPTVEDNNGPVDFKFTGLKNDSVIFESPQHDFPQRIVYFKNGDDKLYACIDGLDSGKYSIMEFIYTKVK